MTVCVYPAVHWAAFPTFPTFYFILHTLPYTNTHTHTYIQTYSLTHTHTIYFIIIF